MNVTVQDMMDARDRRAERQRELLSAYAGQTLLSFTLNIPGPEKDSPLIRRGAALGRRLLDRGLLRLKVRPLYAETAENFTGPESFFVLPLPPLEVKRVAADIEEASPAGRLFDLDVLRPDGSKVDRREVGLPARRCLLCGAEAQVCARSRTHTVEELRRRVDEILTGALRADDCRETARLACQALLDEVNTSPKPGLVDRFNAGSHRDMDIFTFAAAVPALYPYFFRCAEIGADLAAEPAVETFRGLRVQGRLAEGDMLAATGGVNTHKGAVFSLGLLCAAAGRLGREFWSDAGALLDVCAEMTAGLTAADFEGLTPENARTAGQKLFLEYGITGVRGEAERGFPLVRECGLPRLYGGLSRGLPLNDAGCAALTALMSRNPDTNVVHRGGLEGLKKTSARAAALLEREPYPSAESLSAFDRELTAENISPGGSADLLSMCYMLCFLKGAAEDELHADTDPSLRPARQ